MSSYPWCALRAHAADSSYFHHCSVIQKGIWPLETLFPAVSVTPYLYNNPIFGSILCWLMQPCNPAVGGPAKSQLVHEVDALGGEMGKMADRCYVQKRVLNLSKVGHLCGGLVHISPAAYHTYSQLSAAILYSPCLAYCNTLPSSA